MTKDNNKIALFEEYLSTRRRIREIERKALAKIGTAAQSGDICSFCSSNQDETQFLVRGHGEARICAECVANVRGILNDTSDNGTS